MKINSNSSQSFGRIIYEGEKPSRLQKKIINNIIQNKNLTPKLVKDLENLDTDIYIKSNSDKKTVDLTLYSDIDYFGIKVVPYDGRYNSLMHTILNPEKRGEFITNLAISNFFKRANDLDFSSDKNIALVNSVIHDPLSYKL